MNVVHQCLITPTLIYITISTVMSIRPYGIHRPILSWLPIPLPIPAVETKLQEVKV